MGLKKGMTNNPEGRPKGTPNKVTTDLRKWINDFLESQTDKIKEDWEKLEPKDRILFFDRLLRYSLPTLQATSLSTDFDRLSEDELDKIIEGLKSAAMGQTVNILNHAS